MINNLSLNIIIIYHLNNRGGLFMTFLELKARRDFINWFCSHFHYISSGKYNVSLDQITELFQFVYEERRKIDCPLGRNHIHEILYASGWMNAKDQALLSLGLKYDVFVERSDKYIAKFLELDFEHKEKAELRRIRNLNNATNTVKNADHHLTTDTASQLLQFYTTWCADTREVFTEIPTTWKRAIVGRLQRVYKVFCEINEYKPVEPRVLRKFITSKGHNHYTGSYACGMSGQSYFNNLYIPGTGYFHKPCDGLTADGEIEFAAVHNQLVLRIGSSYYTSDGDEVIISGGDLKKHLSERLKRIVPVCADQTFIEEEVVALSNASEASEVINESEGIYYEAEEFEFDAEGETNDDNDNIMSDMVDISDNTSNKSGELENSEDSEELVEEVDVDPETIEMLERLGFTSDKVAEISGKKIKAN